MYNKSHDKVIRALQRQIAANKRLAEANRQTLQYTMQPENGGDPNPYHVDLVDGQFYVNALVRPGGWQALFQTIATRSALPVTAGGSGQFPAGIMPSEFELESMDLDLIFTPKNSITALTPRIVRLWVVKLKRETAMECLQATGGMSTAGLNGLSSNASPNYRRFTYITSMSNTDDPTDSGLFTQVRFNPEFFDVKAYREFTLANIVEETAVTDENTAITGSIDSMLQRQKMHIKCGGLKYKSGGGGFRGLNEQEIEPGDRYYLIAHVGGFAGDGDNQVVMNTNMLVTATTTQ